jgi:outer membrane protein
MKKIHVSVALLFMLALVVIPYRAFAFFGLEAGVGYWKQSPSGTLNYKPVAGYTGDIDLKNDLNFSDQNKPFVRVKVELPLIFPNLYFMATPMSFEQTGSISRAVSFGDIRFDNLAVPVHSKVTLDHMDLALYYPIPLLKTATAGVLNIDLGLNARKVDFSGLISQDDLHLSASKDAALYIPMVYAGMQIKPISLLSIELEGRVVTYGSNHYFDYLGRVKVSPLPMVFIAGGYRAEDLSIDQNDIKAAVTFSGPFIEAGLSF